MVISLVMVAKSAGQDRTAAQMMPGCECSGNNAALGAVELAKRGSSYGTYCAAWEDGVCNATGTAATAGKHRCDGTNASKCETLWPDRDFTKDQSWCTCMQHCAAIRLATHAYPLAVSWSNAVGAEAVECGTRL